jgi:hypothetical protein
VYWSVTARNLTVGESVDGPVWRFRPVPESAPADSVVVPLVYSYWPDNYGFPVCDPDSLLIYPSPAPRWSSAAKWAFDAIPPDTRLTGAAFVLSVWPGYEDRLPGRTAICTAKFSWQYCLSPWPERQTAYRDAFLAEAVRTGPTTVRFESDTLSAHLQAMVRHQAFGLHGYTFSSGVRIDFRAPGSSHASPSRLVLYVARPGPANRP